VTLVTASEGVVASDGSAARSGPLLLSEDATSFWSIGEASFESQYFDGLVFILVRFWPSAVGYLIAHSIGSVSFPGFCLHMLVVAFISLNVRDVLLSLAGFLASRLIIKAVCLIPELPSNPFILDSLVCLSYPQVGLWSVALQLPGKRQRLLVVLLAILQILNLLALTSALYHWVIARDLTPGLASVLRPLGDWESVSACFLPLLMLKRSSQYLEDDKLKEIVTGAVAAGLVTYGVLTHWQVVTLHVALLPSSLLLRVRKHSK
jgi:hypothetical protein